MRSIELFNRGWHFHAGDDLAAEARAHGNLNFIANETRIWQKAGNHAISRPDNPHPTSWRRVDVPHDFVIEGEFTEAASRGNGSLPGGRAWYVKRFELPESDAERRIHIEFDGVYRNSSVFCNGHFLGRHLSGYTSFGFDLTEICNFGGENAIAVHVDATENELWSYEGGGIYRAVRLVKTAPVHVPRWGVALRTGDADDPGRVEVSVTVANLGWEATAVTVGCRVLDAHGGVAAAGEAALSLEAMGSDTAALTLQVANPRLWNIDKPVLYRLETTLRVADAPVDIYGQSFGFRYFHFDPGTGFYLNGKGMKLRGVCCHQDHAGVGVAVPPALQAWRVKRLKSYGCNALRTSHNPPDPALLDACDRLGMLVMDEIRVPGIARELVEDVGDLIRRDRNHPSVILWSLGNEEMRIQDQDVGLRIFRRLQHLAHALDPSRPTTYAMNCHWIGIADFHAKNGFRFDVFGANYRSGQNSAHYDEFHAKYPDWPMLGSETWGGGATRGLYGLDASEIPVKIADRWLRDPGGWTDGYVSAYSNWATPWGYTIEETWQDCAARPFMAGTFIWTGFDYRGETSPYDWPAVVTRFGVLDLCGFYKEIAHYLRAWWRPQAPHLFLMPHWNWEGRSGDPITVRCYGNCNEVELFVNGHSQGRLAMPGNGRLEWEVSYEPGELRAVGYDPEGREMLSVRRRTAGPPAAVMLSSDRDRLVADEQDVIVVNASIVDADGEPCPLSDNLVEFAVTGPGRVLGVGNGNPLSHEPDKFSNCRHAYHGLCQIILQANGAPGRIDVEARSAGIASGSFSAEAVARDTASG